MSANAAALSLHVLSAVIWVGGMFFAYMALRPVAAVLLEPPQRLPLWAGTFARFFPWVWAAVVLLPATGYWMVFDVYRGMGTAPVYVHIMNGLGTVMILVFLAVFFSPYRRLRHAVADQAWKEGARQLARIRRLVATNTVIGVIVLVVATGGRFVPA